MTLGGGALLLSGCASAVQQAQGGSKPKHGGTLHFGQQSDYTPGALLAQGSQNLGVGRALFNSLTHYNTKTLAPEPELATSWSFTGDQTTFTMQLRKGVTFHNGQPLTAEDVLYTIGLVLEPTGGQFRTTAQAITDMSADSDTQITLRFAHPVNNLFDMFEGMLIQSKAQGNTVTQGEPLIGTGPFMWSEYVPNDHLLMKRNPHYWMGGGLPYLDAVELHVVTDQQTLLLQLHSNQLQVGIDLVPQQTIGLPSKFQTVNSPVRAQAYYIGCNVDVAPLDNQKVRQAIAWAANRNRINEQVFRNQYRATAGPWAQTSPAYSASDDKYYTYNPTKAKQLLRQSGVSNPSLTIVPSPSLPECVAISQILQSDLQAVGFDAKIDVVDSATYGAMSSSHKFPGIFVAQHGYGGMHPATLFLGALPFNATSNLSNYSDPKYVTLAQQAWTAGASDAKGVYKQVTDLLLDEAFVIGLVMGGDQVTANKSFRGFSFNAFDYVIYDQAYLG